MGEAKRRRDAGLGPQVHAAAAPGVAACQQANPEKVAIGKTFGEVTCRLCRRMIKRLWSNLSHEQQLELQRGGGAE